MEGGGYANKVGDRYEDLWAVRQLFHLLAEDIRAIEREPVGPDEPGVDLWLSQHDGTRECHQCKKENAGKPGWSIADLAARGVLHHIREQLDRDPQHSFHFVSSIPAPQLKELGEAARHSRDPQTFFDHQAGASKQRKLAIRRFSDAVNLPPEGEQNIVHIHDLLRRTYVHLFDIDNGGGRGLRSLSKQWVVGDPEAVLDALERWIRGQLRCEIAVQQVAEFLVRRGFSLQTLTVDARIRPRITSLQQRFADSLRHQLAGDRLIPRPEAETVLKELQAGSNRLLIVHGVAGAGKSGILYELAMRLAQEGEPYLPVRLDRHSPRISTQHFGKDLGLPASPVHCLHAIAAKGKGILLLDQLDALRWTSSHSGDAWDVCRELINEALSSEVQVVVCCRTFDLEHDPQIRGWEKETAKGVKRIPVGDLPEASIRSAVEGAGLSYDGLSQRERSLLANVLHLTMWVEIIRSSSSAPRMETPRALLRAFWNSRYSELAKVGFSRTDADRVLSPIVEFMQKGRVLSAPESRLNASSDEQRALLSLHILQVEAGRVSFCHQSYLDYLTAERLIAQIEARNTTLLEWLGDPTRQPLFLREQLRLILGFLRDENPTTYIAILRELLSSTAVRFHLKHLVLQSLGQVAKPHQEEVDLVLELVEDNRWRPHVFRQVFFGSTGWLEALDEHGRLHAWLAGEDAECRDTTLSLLRRVAEPSGDLVARLLEPLAGNGEEWALRCERVLPFHIENDSDRLFALRLQLAENGVYRGEHVDWHGLGSLNFDRLTKLLFALLAAQALDLASKSGRRTLGPRETWFGLDAVEVHGVATSQLLLGWQRLTPNPHLTSWHRSLRV